MATVTTNQRQGVNSSKAVKVPCRVASTSNITLSGEQTIDGVAVVDGDRVLVTGQTDASENGIYDADTGAWTRAKDWDGVYDVATGTIVFVTAGTSYNGYWQVSTTGTITVGTTNVSIVQTVPGAYADALLEVLNTDSNAVATTQHEVNERTIHLLDFMSAAQRTDYGAYTASVDISGAITNAIAALPAVGGTIHCGRGNGLISSKVTFNKAVNFLGEGIEESANPGGTTFTKAAVLNDIGFEVTVGGVTFDNFVLDGENGNGGNGIQVKGNRFKIGRLAVYNQGNDGVRIGDDAGTSTNVNLWHIDNLITRSNGRHGLFISDDSGATVVSANANAGTLIHLDSSGNTGDGLKVDNAFFNVFINPVCQSNTGAGIRLTQYAKKNTFFGGDTNEGNTAGEFIIESGAVTNQLIGVQPEGLADAGLNTILMAWDHTNLIELTVGLTTNQYTITAATQANPCQVTAASHGFLTGDKVVIVDVLGMTELNGNTYTVTYVDANNFTLDSTNSTGYTAYSSGGKAIRDNNGTRGAGRLEVAAPNSGGLDDTIVVSSTGNAAAGRGPVINFYPPSGGGNTHAGRFGAVRETAGDDSAFVMYTKAAAGSLALSHRFGSDGSLGVGNSAANTNTPSGATAYELPIYDETGSLLGYIPIYAASW